MDLYAALYLAVVVFFLGKGILAVVRVVARAFSDTTVVSVRKPNQYAPSPVQNVAAGEFARLQKIARDRTTAA